MHVFNMSAGKNESEILTKDIYHANLNVDLMGKNVTQINDGITTNVYVDIKMLM